MDLKQRLFTVLNSGKPDIVPVVSVTQTATVYQMQMTDSFWPESHINPELMASLALAGHTIAGFEAVRYPYCLTVLAEAMGCDVNMGRIDVQPSVITHPLSDKKMRSYIRMVSLMQKEFLQYWKLPVFSKKEQMAMYPLLPEWRGLPHSQPILLVCIIFLHGLY